MQRNQHTNCCISVHVVHAQETVIAENAYEKETNIK